MRLALALAIAALGAVPAAAQQAGDRYGYGPRPKPAALAGVQGLESRGFRPLSWASKAQGPAPASPVSSEPTAGNLPPPPQARPVNYASNAYQPFQPQAPYREATAPAPSPAPAAPSAFRPPAVRAALPTSLHDTPARGPELLGGQAASPPAPAPRQVARAAEGEQVRYYSVHRGYGLTPDAIPEPPADRGYVLIGPPDGARAQDPSAAPDDDGASRKSDRPF